VVSITLTVVPVLLMPGAEWSLPVRFAALALIVIAVPTVVCLVAFALQRATTRKAQPLLIPPDGDKAVRYPASAAHADKNAANLLADGSLSAGRCSITIAGVHVPCLL
jgi:hypothetical protein